MEPLGGHDGLGTRHRVYSRGRRAGGGGGLGDRRRRGVAARRDPEQQRRPADGAEPDALRRARSPSDSARGERAGGVEDEDDEE